MGNSSPSFCRSSRAFCTPVIAPQAGSCVARSRMQSCHGLLVRESRSIPAQSAQIAADLNSQPALLSPSLRVCAHTVTPPCSLPAVYGTFAVVRAVSSSRQRSGGTTALPVTRLGLARSHKAPEAGSCISSVPLGQPGRALTASSQQHRSGFVNPKNTCERLQAKRVKGGSSAKVLCHRGRGNDASHHQARRDGVGSQQCTWVGAGAGCLQGTSAEVGSALLAAEQEQTGSMGAKSGSTGWHGVG